MECEKTLQDEDWSELNRLLLGRISVQISDNQRKREIMEEQQKNDQETYQLILNRHAQLEFQKKIYNDQTNQLNTEINTQKRQLEEIAKNYKSQQYNSLKDNNLLTSLFELLQQQRIENENVKLIFLYAQREVEESSRYMLTVLLSRAQIVDALMNRFSEFLVVVHSTEESLKQLSQTTVYEKVKKELLNEQRNYKKN